MLELAFQPDRGAAEAVYRQLATYLRGLIETGRLLPNVKLPATRELAALLGLNRNTVTQAYQELLAEGLVTARVGQGTFVAALVSDRVTPFFPKPERGGRSFVWPSLFAQRAQTLTLPPGAMVPGAVRFDFRGGQVAEDALPATDLRRALVHAVDFHLAAGATPPDPRGWYPLRVQVAQFLVNRGITCAPEDVAIVNGAQQAIDLVGRVLLDPGDTVVIEQPGYFGAANAFRASQATLVGVGVDDAGLRTDDLARVLRARRVKLVFTTPAAQSPTGVVMSDARRHALLALADEYQTPILEDDYAGELRHGTPPIAALKTIDGADHVVYAGTFSKVLFPGLRLGYLVAAQPLLHKLMLARLYADVGTALLSQVALAEMMESGAFERHVRRMRKVYADRWAVMRAALAEGMPDGVTWTEPAGGHGVWVTLPAGVDRAALFRAATAADVAYTPGEQFYFGESEGAYMALYFTNHTDSEIREGINILAGLVAQHTRRNT